jgi:hypothetical protein
MTSSASTNDKSIDILKSGAIYQLKDIRNLKSPPVIKINKDVTSNTDSIPDINPEEVQHVNQRFELTYRATSSPALQIYQKAIMSSRPQRSFYENSPNLLDNHNISIPNMLSPSSTLLVSNPYAMPSSSKQLCYSPPVVTEVPATNAGKVDSSKFLAHHCCFIFIANALDRSVEKCITG